jgi:RNA polymerase sigma-70 factor, ECF subfamily
MAEPQESEWINAFLAGDEKAFDALVLRYQDRIFNLCYRMLGGDYEEARDAAQEVFVKSYRSLNGFRFRSSFATWLHTIAVNTCKNKVKSWEYRLKKRTESLSLQQELPNGGRSVEFSDPNPSPLAQLTQKENELILQKAIDTLTQEARAIIVLRDVEGLSYEEIVRVTSYNLGTVKSKLARARRQLCRMLQSAQRDDGPNER